MRKKFTMRKVKHSNRLLRTFPADILKNSTSEGSVLRSWPWFDCKVRLDGVQPPYYSFNSINTNGYLATKTSA